MKLPELRNLTADPSSGTPNSGTEYSGGVLTRDDIQEFRSIVRDECGEDITEREAWSRATAASALAVMLVKPIAEDQEAG